VSFLLGAEFFNLFNHPMFTPDTNSFVPSQNFGKTTETLNQGLGELNPLYQIGGPHSEQLTVKIEF
jgi:hypothetical protein